ncbi:hypothetical protein FHX44_118151 [Pseudonocardia hierapolitana]|uniref:Uncharacterized protein n=2 Tax=Pseudonocardia hierapolitana TaxID=1128676 RepID=A0A561T522_9PSEU|nr:hypothetical protein FHX44_118151 [Pseudonocardia hierapolitana]
MTPDLGQGGNQALEDAVTLAALIGHHHDVDAALDMYDTTRRQRTTAVARSSRQVGRIAQAHSPMAVALRNSLIRLLPAGASTRAAARPQTWRPPGPEIDL